MVTVARVWGWHCVVGWGKRRVLLLLLLLLRRASHPNAPKPTRPTTARTAPAQLARCAADLCRRRVRPPGLPACLCPAAAASTAPPCSPAHRSPAHGCVGWWVGGLVGWLGGWVVGWLGLNRRSARLIRIAAAAISPGNATVGVDRASWLRMHIGEGGACGLPHKRPPFFYRMRHRRVCA